MIYKYFTDLDYLVCIFDSIMITERLWNCLKVRDIDCITSHYVLNQEPLWQITSRIDISMTLGELIAVNAGTSKGQQTHSWYC